MELTARAGTEVRPMVQGAHRNKVKGLITELGVGCTLIEGAGNKVNERGKGRYYKNR